MDFEIVRGKIENWLKPELEQKNLFLVDVKFSMGRKIEVFIDSDEGVHIDDCAIISRFLEKKFDEGDGAGLVPPNYILEVSSPGMSNPLKVPRQYKRRIGQVLEVTKTDGTQFEARLTAVDEDKINLQEVLPEGKKLKPGSKQRVQVVEREPKLYEVKYSEIKKAVLQFKF